jgi:hypothetical protein
MNQTANNFPPLVELFDLIFVFSVCVDTKNVLYEGKILIKPK